MELINRDSLLKGYSRDIRRSGTLDFSTLG